MGKLSTHEFAIGGPSFDVTREVTALIHKPEDVNPD